ncbi:MAG: methylmalonyl-CoA mutase, partial [Bacteroidetes bacterium]|nr:methylmalonyl-CoA mutase [Bacteroidota bacterium]
DAMGGSVAAIEADFIQNEIARSAYQYQRAVESGDKIIVGINKFQINESNTMPLLKVDDSIRKFQIEKLNAIRDSRNHAKCDNILQQLNDKAISGENIIPTVIEAVENNCTLGEIADELRAIFGEYK